MFNFSANPNIPYMYCTQFEIVSNTRTECLDLQKNCTSKTVKIRQKIVYIIFVQNVWICRKFDCLELRKLNGKLCTLHVRNVWICRKIECPDLRKFNEKLCMLYVRNFRIGRKIAYIDLQKFSGKLCALYVRNVWLCRKFEYPDL